MTETEIKKLEEELGYRFKNAQLLERALTRKAYANEQKQKNHDCEDQEIFCTLGDAVLTTVLVDLLMNNSGCRTSEEITNRKIELVSEEGLAKISRKLEIGYFIKLGLGEKKRKDNEKPSVLAETLEAIIGAIYLDGGYDASKDVIAKLYPELKSP